MDPISFTMYTAVNHQFWCDVLYGDNQGGEMTNYNEELRSGKEFLFRLRGYREEGISSEDIKADMLEKLTKNIQDLVFWMEDDKGWVCSLFARTPQSDEENGVVMLEEKTQVFLEETIKKAIHDMDGKEGYEPSSKELARAICLVLKRKGYEIGVKGNHEHVTESTDL